MKTFKELYESGARVAVDFFKCNGDRIHLICQRDAAMESVMVTISIPESNDVLPVVEVQKNGNRRLRFVPLHRIENFWEANEENNVIDISIDF